MSQRVPVYVLAGQSNANNPILIREMESRVSAEGGRLVHVAANGTSLSPALDRWGSGDWGPGDGEGEGELLHELEAAIDHTLSSAGPGAYLAGVIWIQGEADSWSLSAARDYGASLMALHDRLTERYGTHRMTVSGLSDLASDWRHDTANHARNWDLVRLGQAMAADSDPSISLVNPDALGVSPDKMFRYDYVHYDADFAKRLADALFEVATDPVPGDARTLTGSAENDRFVIDTHESARVMGGQGHDELYIATANSSSVIRVENDGVVRVEDAGTNAIINCDSVERLTTGSGADRIVVDERLDMIASGLGRDNIRGSGDADYIHAGQGDDRISAAEGSDTLVGAQGNDTLIASGGNDRAWGQGDNDVIHLGRGNDLGVGGAGNDRIWGGSGRDRLMGNEGDDYINGGTGKDNVTGGGGSDTIIGGAGDDRVWGNQDADRIQLGGGNDLGSGGAGRDLIWGEDGNDRLAGGDGHDYLNGGNGRDTLIGGHGNDRAVGGAGYDLMFGGFGNDTLDGEGGNDRIFAGAGDDKLRGGGGHDYLIGGIGDDLIQGGDGNDRIIAGGGDDHLYGGAGDDVFVIIGQSGHDTIRDFAPGSDRLSFHRGLDVSAHQEGADVVLDWHAGNGAHGTVTLIDCDVAQVMW